MFTSEGLLLGKIHKRQIYVTSSKLHDKNWRAIPNKVSFVKTIWFNGELKVLTPSVPVFEELIYPLNKYAKRTAISTILWKVIEQN